MRQEVVTCRAIVLLGCLLFTGCVGEPYTYEPANDLKPGPGLFSGEDGEFTIIGNPEEQKEEAQKEE